MSKKVFFDELCPHTIFFLQNYGIGEVKRQNIPKPYPFSKFIWYRENVIGVHWTDGYSVGIRFLGLFGERIFSNWIMDYSETMYPAQNN